MAMAMAVCTSTRRMSSVDERDIHQLCTSDNICQDSDFCGWTEKLQLK